MARTTEVRQVRGQRYWREADAQVMVNAWRASGEGLAEFARRHGVDRKRLGRWVKRIEEPEAVPVRFHPVEVTATRAEGESGSSIEIQLPAGERIRVSRGFAAEDLHRVLQVLEEWTRC